MVEFCGVVIIWFCLCLGCFLCFVFFGFSGFLGFVFLWVCLFYFCDLLVYFELGLLLCFVVLWDGVWCFLFCFVCVFRVLYFECLVFLICILWFLFCL